MSSAKETRNCIANTYKKGLLNELELILNSTLEIWRKMFKILPHVMLPGWLRRITLFKVVAFESRRQEPRYACALHMSRNPTATLCQRCRFLSSLLSPNDFSHCAGCYTLKWHVQLVSHKKLPRVTLSRVRIQGGCVGCKSTPQPTRLKRSAHAGTNVTVIAFGR